MKIKLYPFFVFTLLAFLPSVFRTNAQVASFSANPNSGCAPLSVTFTNNSTGATSYSWDFGNGNTSVNPPPPVGATYLNPGVYSVKLTASNGSSSNVATITITVFPKPVANYTSNVTTTICVGEPAVFTDATIPGGGPINNWHWDFGDGSNQTTVTGSSSHSYTSPGTFPVSLIATDVNGCFSSIIHTINVLPAPVVSFSGNVLFSCFPPLAVNFTNTSTSTGSIGYLWNFGDGNTSTQPNPSHTYAGSGLYTVKLIITQGACVDSLVKTNYVIINNIVADFAANNTSVCTGQTVSFTDLSIPLSVSRTWDFGDGTTSTAANPTHQYTTPGSYTVSLLNASASSGCDDDTIKTNYITVFPSISAAFTANDTVSCSLPFTVNFTDNSVNATNWLWHFGDGTTSTLQNPVHTYFAVGSDTVTLISSNANGCFDTIVKANYITISPPVANFFAIPRMGCVPLTVNFVSASASSVDAIVNYHWDFGNGIVTNTASPVSSSIYNSPGFFTVKLVITTVSGCKDSIILTNYIKAGTQPSANFSIVDSTVCFGTLAMFNDLSVIPPADSAFWLFGDGAVLSASLPMATATHLYPDTGTFSVTEIAYYNGCPDTMEYVDIVNILPSIPKFTYQLNCLNYYTVNFVDASIGADTIFWDFGDGFTDSTNNPAPVHTYLSNGPKTVTLVSANTNGCSFFYTTSFVIAEPIARFTSDTIGCYPLPETITNFSQDVNSAVWSFGDGTANSIAMNPPHTYALPGMDTLKLIITDVNGCKDTAFKIIKILGPIPQYNASIVTGCTPLLVTFTDASIDDSTLVQWNWNFGDGSTGQNTIPSMSHTYTTPGLYSVTMTVKDTNQCSKTLVKTNYIEPTYPKPAFTVAAAACKGENITFNASLTVAAAPAQYAWNFGDGTTGTGTAPSHIYNSDNLYTVSLTVTDKNGCDSTIQHQILIQKPHALFKDSVINEGCGYTNIQFTDISTGASNNGWQWSFGDGASSTQQNPMHSYTQPGFYSVNMVVTNIAGCKDTMLIDSIVVVPGPIGTFSFSPLAGCNPLTVTFKAISSNSTSYSWDFGDGTLTTMPTPLISHTYWNDNVYHPILLLSNILTDGTVCQLPATPPGDSVIVSTLMHINVDSTVITLNQDEEFIITSTVTNVLGSPVYSWSPSGGLSCVSCQTPVITGNGSGQSETYSIILTDPSSGACISYDSILINHPLCQNDLTIPNIFTPNDDGINDIFRVKGTCEKSDYLLQIYDRWGLKMFSAEVKNLSWDGTTISGAKASDGVYYYVITVDDKPFTGFLQLIR